MEGPARLGAEGMESGEGSEWSSTAKLLLVEGMEAERLDFFPTAGFLLFLFRGATFVNPSS